MSYIEPCKIPVYEPKIIEIYIYDFSHFNAFLNGVNT